MNVVRKSYVSDATNKWILSISVRQYLWVIILGKDQAINVEEEIMALEATSDDEIKVEELDCKGLDMFGVSSILSQVRIMKLERGYMERTF